MPASVQPSDQVIATVTESGRDTVSATGYAQVAQAFSGPDPTITLVGTTSGQSSATSSTFSVPLPPGVAPDDQIVVGVVHAGSDTATVPGYARVNLATTGSNPQDASTEALQRTAAGGETSVTITGSTGSLESAVVAVYRGVDPKHPVDSSVAGQTSLGTSLTVPALSAGDAHELGVLVQGAVTQTPPGTWTPPAGLIERVQNAAQPLRTAGLADQPITNPGTVGPFTSTLTTTNNTGANLAGVAVILRPARAAKTVVFRRTTVAGDSQIVFTLSPGTTATATVAVYRGVDPTNPVDAISTSGAPNTSSMTLPALTPTIGGEQLVYALGSGNDGGYGWYLSKPDHNGTVTDSRNSYLADEPTADFTPTSSGAIGPFPVGMSPTNPSWPSIAGIALTLRPDVITSSYDGNGNLTSTSDGGAISYDPANRATALTPPGGGATSFTYRGENQTERATMSPATRVNAACPVIARCPISITTLAASATFETTALGVSAETDGTATTYWIRDPRGGLLAQLAPNGTSYYLTNGQNSVVGLTDPTGSVVASYGYDPYGRLTTITGGPIATNNPWRWISGYQDGTGLYKLGARYYDPTNGRFTRQDPAGTSPFDPHNWNPYTYAGGDPINGADPSGLDTCGNVVGFASFFGQLVDCFSRIPIRAAIDYQMCVFKGMLPVNPDDVIVILNAEGGDAADNAGIYLAEEHIALDISKELAKKALERATEKLAIHGVPVVGWIITAAEGAYEAYKCA